MDILVSVVETPPWFTSTPSGRAIVRHRHATASCRPLPYPCALHAHARLLRKIATSTLAGRVTFGSLLAGEGHAARKAPLCTFK